MEKKKLVVKTTVIYDSLLSDNIFFDHKVIEQQLEFYKNDTLIKTFLFNPPKIVIRTSHIKKISVYENIIDEISILKGKNGWLYEISGGGITLNQTEYFGLFNPEGKLLFYSYSPALNKHVRGLPYDKHKGNLYSVLKKYGIDLNLFSHPQNVVTIDY